MADVFLDSANFASHAFLTLAPPSGYALNLKVLIKLSKVSWTSQLSYEMLRSSFERKFDKKNFISPKRTPPKSPHSLGLRTSYRLFWKSWKFTKKTVKKVAFGRPREIVARTWGIRWCYILLSVFSGSEKRPGTFLAFDGLHWSSWPLWPFWPWMIFLGYGWSFRAKILCKWPSSTTQIFKTVFIWDREFWLTVALMVHTVNKKLCQAAV